MEVEFFDVMNRIDKRAMWKKQRICYINEPITFKFLMKNPLMSEVVISDLFLKCLFVSKKQELVNPLEKVKEKFTAVH
jgi:hypothetical protein